MDIFDLFQKRAREMHVREKLQQGFESAIAEVIDIVESSPSPIRELALQSAIVSYYKSMKESELVNLCNENGINFQSILEEEYKNILNKYFE